MKKIIVLALIGLMATLGIASAEEGLKIGYVNMRKALNECKAGKSAKEKLEKSIKEKQVQLDDEKKKLESMQEDFDKKASLLSDKAKQEKVQTYQKLVADAQKEINEKEGEATKKIVEGLKDVISEMAKKESYTLIFEETEISVLYAKDGLDLTDKVIDKYNEKAKE